MKIKRYAKCKVMHTRIVLGHLRHVISKGHLWYSSGRWVSETFCLEGLTGSSVWSNILTIKLMVEKYANIIEDNRFGSESNDHMIIMFDIYWGSPNK